MTFGERILLLRTKLGITQDELAQQLGYKSRSSIAKIESNERDVTGSTIIKLSLALNVTPSTLLGWHDKEFFGENGHIKKLTPAKTSRSEMQNQLSKLSDAEKTDILNYVDDLLAKRDSEK
jgi:transcriptional regulator with XRE-family HTH domain